MTGTVQHPPKSSSVHCIVVTYNGLSWIEKCLNSLFGSSCPVEVMVVDNGSTDGTLPLIREKFPQVRIVATGKNLGFGQANNIGLVRALEEGASHIFLLNQDAWVEQDTIRDLIGMHRDNQTFGILSPLHLNGSGTALDIYFSEYLLRSDLQKPVSSWLLELPDPPPLIETCFVNAAAWLISAECVRRTGGFDPIFFHYGEDVNYVQRVLFNGFRIGICTGARIYHDREQRISTDRKEERHMAGALASRKLLKKDRVHFLNQACDIRYPGYKGLIMRRLLRYSFLTVTGLFSKTQRQYNFQMAATALTSIPAVQRSRKKAKGLSPFLK